MPSAAMQRMGNVAGDTLNLDMTDLRPLPASAR